MAPAVPNGLCATPALRDCATAGRAAPAARRADMATTRCVLHTGKGSLRSGIGRTKMVKRWRNVWWEEQRRRQQLPELQSLLSVVHDGLSAETSLIVRGARREGREGSPLPVLQHRKSLATLRIRICTCFCLFFSCYGSSHTPLRFTSPHLSNLSSTLHQQ